MCKEANVKGLVDDLAKYAISLPPLAKVVLFDQPWNQNFQADNKNSYRAEKQWEDVPEIVEKKIIPNLSFQS